MNGVPYKISQNIIGSMDIIDRIGTHITSTVFKNTYPTLLRLKPKLLDHIMNLMWDETDKTFPGYVHCKCSKKCIRKFKMSYLLKGYKRHTHLESDRSDKIKERIRLKMGTYYLELMKIVGDPLITKINSLY